MKKRKRFFRVKRRSGERKPAGRETDRPVKESGVKRKFERKKAKQKTAAIVVGGTRDLDDKDMVFKHLDRLTKKYKVVAVLTGANIDDKGKTWQAGPDKLAKEWAFKKWYNVRLFYAEWGRFNKSAGPKRNEDMIQGLLEENADVKAGIFFWNGKSPGTKDTIRRCRTNGITVRVIQYKE